VKEVRIASNIHCARSMSRLREGQEP
jgi:hypothetical protein